MFTIPEFRAAADRYCRRVAGWGFAVILAAPVLAWGPLLLYGVLAAPPGVAPADVVSGWAVAVSCVAFVILLFGGLLVLDRRLKRPAVLGCRHCGGSLLEPAAWIVVASRHCPHCGRRVLAEPDDPGEPARPLADVAAAADRAAVLPDRMIWPVAIAFLGPSAVLVPAALYRDTIRDQLRWVGGADTVGDVVMAAGLLPMLIAVVWMLLVGRRLEREAGTCPRCRVRLQPRQVAVTGNCGRCGHRVAVVPPDPGDGPLIPVAAAVASGRWVSRAAWRRIGGGMAVGVVLLIGLGVLAAGGRRERFGAELERRYGAVEAVVIESVVGGVAALVVLLTFFGGVWSAVRNLSTAAGGGCPHCGSPFGGPGLTIATRRCAKCRRRIIADPEPNGVAAGAPAG